MAPFRTRYENKRMLLLLRTKRVTKTARYPLQTALNARQQKVMTAGGITAAEAIFATQS